MERRNEDSLSRFKWEYWKISLELVGLWPRQSVMKRRIMLLFLGVLYSSIFISSTLFVIETWEVGLCNKIREIAHMIASATYLTVYLIAYSNASKISSILTESVKVCQNILDEQERKILSISTEFGRKIGIVIAAYFLAYSALVGSMTIGWALFDQYSPSRNDIQKRIHLPHISHLFFNQENHYYVVSVHLNVFVSSGSLVIGGLAGMFLLLVKQISGLFSVVRLKNVVRYKSGDRTYQNVSAFFTRQNIILAVDLHRKTLRLCALLEELETLTLMACQIPCVMMLSLFYFYLARVNDSFAQSVIIFISSVGINIFLLSINWAGQEIINHSEEVFNSIWVSEWYLLPAQERKLLLVIMYSSSQPRCLTSGKLSIVSMETYTKLLNLTYSYYTALLAIN